MIWACAKVKSLSQLAIGIYLNKYRYVVEWVHCYSLGIKELK